MAVTALPYGQFLQDLLSGVHNVASDTDKVALLTSAYTPDLDAHVSFADVVSAEVSGNGYSAGGVVLANMSIVYSSSTNTASVTADSATWTDLAVTCRYAVVYRSSNANSNAKLIGLIDFGADRIYATEPFELSFPNGAINIGSL